MSVVFHFTIVIAGSNHGFNELGIVPFYAFRILVPALPAVFFAIAVASARLADCGSRTKWPT